MRSRLSKSAATPLLTASLCLPLLYPLHASAYDGEIIDGFTSTLMDVYRDAIGQACPPGVTERRVPSADLAEGAVALEGETTELIDSNTLVFSGNAEIEKDGLVINSERLKYNKSNDTFTGEGNVRIQSPEGHIFKADSMEMEIATEIGSAKGVEYTLVNTQRKPKREDRAFVRAHGKADSIEFVGKDLISLQNATYSTCRKDKEIAVLTAGDIELDTTAGTGKAKNMKLRLYDVPVFWFPYVSFPIDDTRKTGFLMPSIGSTTRSGTVVNVPYYWNIAPNMDATFAGTYYSKRGLQGQGEYRYLSKKFKGQLLGTYLPDDDETGEDRYAYHVGHNQRFTNRWRADVDFTEVSDADYFNDFSDEILFTSATYLRQNVSLGYAGDWLRGDAQYTNFQTIDETIPESVRPYTQEPRVVLSTNLPSVNRFKFYGYAEYNNFQRDERVSGPRTDLLGSAEYDFNALYGFFKPKVSARYTGYDLETVDPGAETSPTRSLGTFSLDTGLFFDRLTAMKGKDYTQTLEPRIYYLYVPFEDQDDIPIFDTGATSFSVSQMFRENRFTSADRIGDANQVTLALTSRLLESDSGRELLRGMIGQIYYFDDRKVTLPGGEPQTFGRSDFVGELYVNLADRLKMFNFLQWNAEDSELDQFRTDLRYTHGPGKVFNLGYYYVQGGLDEQINADLAWPLSPRWDLTARTRYSFTDDRSLESGLGIGYGACCWGLRLSALRRVDNQSEDVDSILLEFELNGLTTLSRGFGDTATVIP